MYITGHSTLTKNLEIIVFKLISVVTKSNPRTASGGEVFSYPKADLSIIEAIPLFEASAY